jgi:hypothetical protein
MKKTLFSLLALVALHAQATVLVVKEYGVNSTYSTINAALTAAANNDTIVVYDKPSGQAWIENLTIDKNLTFLHPTPGTRFKAPGEITVVPKAGMDLYFIGWDMNTKSITATATGATATSANRAKITVTDCTNLVNVDLNVDWIDARIFYNQTNMTGNITYRHGIAVANLLSNGGIRIEQEATNAAENDSIIIVGNKAKWCYVDTREAGIIANNFLINTSNIQGLQPGGSALVIKNHNTAANAIFGIYNNSIQNSQGNSITASVSGTYCNVGINCQNWTVTTSYPHGLSSGNSVTMSGWSNGNANGTYSVNVTGPNTFTYGPTGSGNCNCTIGTVTGGSITFNSGGTALLAGIAFTNSVLANVQIINNLVYTTTSNLPNYGVYNVSTTGQPLISHNYINAVNAPSGNICTISFNNELNYTSTTANAFGSIDTWGRAASGNTNLINKGNYLGQYYDIDLTRNDIGTYGGPYSIDNYLTGGVSKGRGLFIDIPHQLTNLNQIINAKAAAGSKF